MKGRCSICDKTVGLATTSVIEPQDEPHVAAERPGSVLLIKGQPTACWRDALHPTNRKHAAAVLGASRAQNAHDLPGLCQSPGDWSFYVSQLMVAHG